MKFHELNIIMLLKRNTTISIAKAIGIILMVIGHSGCPNWIHNYIYMYHMPLFFFCSGYFFKDIKDTNQIKVFIIRKCKGLYIPYVKWSILFLLLHNLFYDINIYNELYNGVKENPYNVMTFIRKILNIAFAMRDTELLLGGFWFLRALFLSSIALCIISMLKNIYKLTTMSY